MHKVIASQFVTLISGSCYFPFCKICKSTWLVPFAVSISALVNGFPILRLLWDGWLPAAFIALQSSGSRLSNVPASLSFYETFRSSPYAGRIHPCFESQFLHESCNHFISQDEQRKTSPVHLLQFSHFRRSLVLRHCMTFTSCNHGFRKSAPLLSMPCGLGFQVTASPHFVPYTFADA